MKTKNIGDWWNRPSRGFEIGLVAVAFGLRLAYLLQVRDNPLFANPTLDAAYHLNWAKSIAGGALWGTDVFFRAPFYPYLLAVFYKITGGDLFGVRLLQHLIGVASVWGVYRLSRLMFSESAAKIAALAAAIYTPLIYFEDELLLDFLLIPWMLLAFFAADQAHRTRRPRWIFVLGLTVGLFAVTRPNILVCVPVFGWWVWRWCATKNRLRARAEQTAWLLLGVLLPILPVTAHNVLVGKDLVLIASQGGINFYIGNNAEADGLSAAMPQPWGNTWQLPAVQLYAENKAGRKLKPSEFSSFWLNEGLKWWAGDPFAALKLTFKKAVILFSNTEISNNQDIRFFWRNYAPLVRLLPLSFGILAPLGLVGLLLSARHKPLVALMLWVLLLYAVSVVAFFVPARFRLPLLPPLFVGFGVFIEAACQYVTRRQWRPAARMAAPAALLIVLSLGPWYQTQPATDAQAVFQLGNAALRSNALDQAADYFRQALVLHPGYPNAHMNLGVILLKKQQLDDAAAEFLAEIQSNPQSGAAYANLCTLRQLQGRLAEAEELGKKALSLEPANPTALAGLSKVFWAMKRYREAVTLLESAPPGVRDSPVGRNLLGGLYVQLRRDSEAEQVLLPLVEGQVRLDLSKYDIDRSMSAEELGYNRIDQHQADAHYNLGWMYARQEDLPRAVDHFKQAISLRPEFSEAHANLGAAYISLDRPDSALACFQKAAALDSRNAGYIFNLGIARLHLGDTTAAGNEFRRALGIDPNFTPAKQKLQALARRRVG